MCDKKMKREEKLKHILEGIYEKRKDVLVMNRQNEVLVKRFDLAKVVGDKLGIHSIHSVNSWINALIYRDIILSESYKKPSPNTIYKINLSKFKEILGLVD